MMRSCTMLTAFVTIAFALTTQAILPKDETTSYTIPKVESISTSEYFWKEITTHGSKPERREGHTSVSSGGYLIFFGGCSLSSECFNDVHILDTMSVQSNGVETMRWKKPTIFLGNSTSVPPASRSGHTASMVGEKMYVFGGKSQSIFGGEDGYLSDVHSLSLLQPSSRWHAMNKPQLRWDKVHDLEDPSVSVVGREGHSAAVYEDRYIYIFGGYALDEEDGAELWMNDLLILDADAENKNNVVWESVSQPPNGPSPREDHTATIAADKMYIFGGFGYGKSYDDLLAFDLKTRGWERLQPHGNAPRSRGGAAATLLLGSRILLIGGCDFDRKRECYSDVYMLKTKKAAGSVASLASKDEGVGIFDSSIWMQVPVRSEKAFAGREGHTLTLSNNRMFVFGGCSFSRDCFNNVIELAPIQDARKACSTTQGASLLCSGHGECLQRGVPPAQPYFDCECDEGWESWDCSKQMQCPVGATDNLVCSGHGVCSREKLCECDDGFFSSDCSQQHDTICPADSIDGSNILQCSGKGKCVHGKCLCNPPWTGLSCNVLEKCQKGGNGQACSGHGKCVFPGPVMSAMTGSLDSIARTVETKGILWFESPEVNSQEKDRSTDVFLQLGSKAKQDAEPGKVGGQDDHGHNHGVQEAGPPVLAKQLPFFYCKCLVGFAGADCGRPIKDPTRFFFKVYISGIGNYNEGELLLHFYKDMLFNKLRVSVGDFAKVGLDQVLLLSARTKSAEIDEKDENGNVKRPDSLDSKLLMLQMDTKARQSRGHKLSSNTTTNIRTVTFNVSGANHTNSVQNSSDTKGSFDYDIVSELVIRAYSTDEVASIEKSLIAESNSTLFQTTFTQIMNDNGWKRGDAGIAAFHIVPNGFISPRVRRNEESEKHIKKLLNISMNVSGVPPSSLVPHRHRFRGGHKGSAALALPEKVSVTRLIITPEVSPILVLVIHS